MCTVSWRIRAQGYDLFFNRDELNTRAPELAPFIDEQAGVRFIAPRDGDQGGAWLLANEHGITVCLQNDYATAWRPGPSGSRFSRGHVVLALASVRTAGEIPARVGALPLDRTAPFQLLALSPGAEPVLLHWPGAGPACRREEIVTPVLTSSSFATAEVIAARLRHFAQYVRRPGQPQRAELAAFHRQHDPAAGAFSVAMCRPDAATRSFIRVSVDRRSVTLAYEPACWRREGRVAPIRLRLPRRADAASSVRSTNRPRIHRAGLFNVA